MFFSTILVPPSKKSSSHIAAYPCKDDFDLHLHVDMIQKTKYKSRVVKPLQSASRPLGLNHVMFAVYPHVSSSSLASGTFSYWSNELMTSRKLFFSDDSGALKNK